MRLRFPFIGRALLAVVLGGIGIASFAIRGTNHHHSPAAYALLLVGSVAIAASAILWLVIADKCLSKNPG